MNSANDIKIVQHKDYESAIKLFVEDILYKFALMQTPFEPLTKVVKNYDKNILRRSVVNVLFKNYGKQARKKSFWVLRNPSRKPEELAKMVIAEEKRLKTLVWKKNEWGDPFKPVHKQIHFKTGVKTAKDWNPNVAVTSIELDKFFYDHWDKLAYYVPNEERRAELLASVLEFGTDLREAGFAEGIKKNPPVDVELMMKIYNGIELPLYHLKKFIDEQ
jgi:hypothetical protein